MSKVKLEGFKDLALAIISGSSQSQGQSLKLGKYIQGFLKHNQVPSSVIDLHALALPTIGFKTDSKWLQRWKPASEKLRSCQGLVLISPEYNGGPSPAVLNALFYVTDELRHKPVLLIGVSSGRGGKAPILALRQFGMQDTGYVVLPDSLVVSNVAQVFNDHDFQLSQKLSKDDRQIRRRLALSLKALLIYSQALQGLQDKL